MSTLAEDLERVAITLRTVTDHEVEVVHNGDDHSIYVNFGPSEALVLETTITPAGQMWSIEAYAWDRTHGVSAHKELGWCLEAYVAGVVRIFLEAEDARVAALEALLASAPED